MTTANGSGSMPAWRARRALGFCAFGAVSYCLCSNAAIAAVTATGDFNPDPLVADSTVEIGAGGYGTLRIDDGSTFESSFVRLGQQPGGFGVATVKDAGSTWTIDGGVVGANGFGRLNILGGGVVELTFGDLEIGDNSNGRGEVLVEGDGSLLHVGGQLRLGTGGTGIVEVRAGGVVNVPGNIAIVDGTSQIKLANGLFRARGLHNFGVIGGTGEISVAENNSVVNSGRIETRTGDELLINSQFGELENRGALLVDGGKIEVRNGIGNYNTGSEIGSITLRSGELRAGVVGRPDFNAQLVNRGALTVIGGENHVYGNVRNDFQGAISVLNESLVVFHNDIETYHGSVMSVASDSHAIILDDLFMFGGTLLADITGAEDYGQVEVLGNVQLNGTLQINVADDFVPIVGDSFELLKAQGGISLGFLAFFPPPLPAGLEWNLGVGSSSIVLSVVETPPPLLGDYNLDGIVDAADYTVWRNALNSGDLSADGDHSGYIDGNDYEVWKLHYGETSSPGGGGLSHAVPEPASGFAVCIGAMALVVLGRARRSRG